MCFWQAHHAFLLIIFICKYTYINIHAHPTFQIYTMDIFHKFKNSNLKIELKKHIRDLKWFMCLTSISKNRDFSLWIMCIVIFFGGVLLLNYTVFFHMVKGITSHFIMILCLQKRRSKYLSQRVPWILFVCWMLSIKKTKQGWERGSASVAHAQYTQSPGFVP